MRLAMSNWGWPGAHELAPWEQIEFAWQQGIAI
jgi:hypothetical protein